MSQYVTQEMFDQMMAKVNALEANHSSASAATPFAGLNQWSLEYKPRMEDFNADNQKIDDKLRMLSQNKLDRAVMLGVNTDLNECYHEGVYFSQSASVTATMSNTPTVKMAFTLEVYTFSDNKGGCIQKYTTHSGGTYNGPSQFVRSCYTDNGNRIWREWEMVATAKRPALIEIPFMNGVAKYKDSYYAKTDFGLVTVNASFKKENGLINGLVLGQLPSGFRPSTQLDIPAIFTGTTRQPGIVVISTDGKLTAIVSQTASYGYITTGFYVG